MKNTEQQNFWKSSFGDKYTNRNLFNPKKLDNLYKRNFGITKSRMNKDFISGLKIEKILEVGCNVGNQLLLLQKQGYKSLYGIEINQASIELSKKTTKNLNIIHGSSFDIPFKDNYFDLVFTAGVLIHISPKDLKSAMKEIYRTSSKYIWGYEYFSKSLQQLDYRGNRNRLWKNDFAKLYMNYFPDLKLIKHKIYTYKDDSENMDAMFLLKK